MRDFQKINWNIPSVLAAFIFSLLITMVFLVIVFSFIFHKDSLDTLEASNFALVVQNLAMLFAVYIFINPQKRAKFKIFKSKKAFKDNKASLAKANTRSSLYQLGFRKVKWSKAITWILLFVFLYYMITFFISLLLGSGEQPSFEQFKTQDWNINFVIIASVIIVVAPFVEEIFFRGFIFPAFAKKTGLILGALISSVWFGCLHIQDVENLSIIPILSAFGFILCMLYYKTNSLYPPIILHSVNNALASFALWPSNGLTLGCLFLLTVVICVVMNEKIKPPSDTNLDLEEAIENNNQEDFSQNSPYENTKLITRESLSPYQINPKQSE